MIRIFTGDDRIKAMQEIKRLFGDNYETIDCADLKPKDLTPIFLGTTFFDSKRRILLRDFTANSAIFSEITKFLNTPHEVILLETKLDKRTSTYKEIKTQIEIKEFNLPPATDFRAVFDIYKIAKTDGKKAVQILRKIEITEDPIRFTGLLISQALKDFQKNQGTKEKSVLKALAKLDTELKSTKIDPWLLVESFLVRVSNLS